MNPVESEPCPVRLLSPYKLNGHHSDRGNLFVGSEYELTNFSPDETKDTFYQICMISHEQRCGVIFAEDVDVLVDQPS